MTDLYFEGQFERWPETKFCYPGIWQKIGWRFFAVSGAQSSVEKVNTESGAALRLARHSDVGDSGLDQNDEDLRILLPPNSQVYVRVWARRITSQGVLNARLAEFKGSDWLNLDNQHLFPLTRQFESYTFQVTLSPDTTEVSIGLRIDTIGEIDILRVELGPVESTGGKTPRILLPQGQTLNAKPVLWWRASGHAAHQVQMAKDIHFQNISWDSGIRETGSKHLQLPECTPGEVQFTRVRVQSFDQAWSPWSDPTILVYDPLKPLPAQPLVVYDLNPTRDLPPEQAFEQAHLVSALQGLANREKPEIALQWIKADEHWLERLRQPDRWLEKTSLIYCNNLEELLDRFSDVYEGVVLWDPEVPATSNVASTIAGVENLLPIPYRNDPESLYQKLVENGPKLQVKRSLVGMFTGSGTIPDTGEKSSGSAKNDAYRWAIAMYLESGLCNPARLGYYIDAYWIKHCSAFGDYSNHTLTNHDFFIMHQGFFWDLNVWEDDLPIDDPDQPLGTDYHTLLRLLSAASARLKPGEMIHCGGFTPWAWKYCDWEKSGGKYRAVPTEWETVRILSAYNAFLDADALGLGSLSNASLYWHFYLAFHEKGRMNQPPPPLPEECREQGWLTPEKSSESKVIPHVYLLHYIGDYDSAAWLISQVPSMWEDFRRGQIPLPWNWNPNLMERGMPMFDEYLRTRTPKDVLWSGDNGAGYMAPTQLFPPRPPAGIPSGADRWRNHCRNWFRKLDLRHIGFIINGNAGPLTPEVLELYQDFAGDGIVARETEVDGNRLFNSMPVVEMGHNGLCYDPKTSAKEIAKAISKNPKKSDTPFMVVRSVLREPSYYYRTNRAFQRQSPDYKPEFLGPAEFFYLLRHHLGGKNTHRAGFLYDTIPNSLKIGAIIQGKLWLRNLGWSPWANEGSNAVQVAIELAPDDERRSPQYLSLPAPVAPGGMVEIDFTLTTPTQPGTYYWRIDLKEGESWFSENGNLPDARRVEVKTTRDHG